MKCRFCGTSLKHVFIDLINSPPSNSFLTADQLNELEIFYPLKLFVCDRCFLVQIDEYKKSEEIFSDEYIYFSSYSSSWIEHASQYCSMIVSRLNLNANSLVIEVASNDGYLLQFFKEKKIPCLGIEPSKITAEAAVQKGIKVITEFLSQTLAIELRKNGYIADLIIGNNVLAHVPNLNEFVKALKYLLKRDGTITLEFPHLMNLIEHNQFDTIYHEHYSYLSFHTVKKIFETHGLEIYDVDEIPTHGGSLRVYAKHEDNIQGKTSKRVYNLLDKELSAGMNEIKYYMNFQNKIDRLKNEILFFLIEQKMKGKKVIAYGAAAKGNTLINYCGIKQDLISIVVDASPHKQNKYLPGSHIPVRNKSEIEAIKPDFIIILPWNLENEIINQLKYIKKWNGRFVIFIPHLKIIE